MALHYTFDAYNTTLQTLAQNCLEYYRSVILLVTYYSTLHLPPVIRNWNALVIRVQVNSRLLKFA